ncbi:uncharacterized protein BDR25DRAFT_341597 [Lindgomyces ingoldianus]|uniref:Uncharacterized protein n=1 Tax=Lindgomyces ingoldianus TaxID=673940 RepID=A0ACB6R1R1_9PLEO|nr:uncharacterized protein BDR25DRAFT_341597 [Lindgomyces ingoldianus]KAF2472720.1 hypothetical protein BDR25DRAFT_341597 [Lindgomyces ingoldianus]
MSLFALKPVGATSANSPSTAPILRQTNDPRYPKRKRNEVRYVASDVSDSDLDVDDSTDSETDAEEYGVMKKRVRTYQPCSSKPLPKHKIFPFMSLPAELRNRIYEECLPDMTRTTEEHRDGDTESKPSIWFYEKQKSYKRTVEQILASDDEKLLQHAWTSYSNFLQRGTTSSGRLRPVRLTEDSDAEDDVLVDLKPKRLALSILAVSKTIYAEAAPMLYSQILVFTDTSALMAFASQLSSMTARLLRHIKVQLWISTRSRKSTGFSAMAMLAAKGATELETMHINCSIGHFWSYSWRDKSREQKVPKRVARKVYRECYLWLEAVGRAKGDLRAGVEVLRLCETNFEGWDTGVEDGVRMYKEELGRLLGGRV